MTDTPSDPNYPRAVLGSAAGLRIAFAFPVVSGREVLAVMEFFSTREETPDDALVAILTDLGSQLGRAVEREQAATALAVSEAQAQSANRAKSDFLANMSHEIRTPMHQLRDFGIELTLDDFSTGYSSLSYLKQLPLQHLKVDQSFVRDIEQNANDAAIVRAVLALAGALNLRTVAEGVETASQLQFIDALGCHTVQGFLFSPAVNAVAFSDLIDAGRMEIPAAH